MIAELALILAIVAHLLSVNVASAAPLAAIGLEWRWSSAGDPAAGELGRQLAHAAWLALLAGIITGGLLLGVVWLAYPDPFFGAARQIPPDRYWWGGAELLFSLAVWGVYCLAWHRWHRRRWLHRAFGAVSVANLVYHFPLLFAAISVLSTRPDTWQDGVLTRGELMALLFDGETLIRFAHFMLASLAVTGVYMMSLGLRPVREGKTGAGALAVVWGARIALAATAFQLLAGPLLLVRLPGESQNALVGGDTLGTALFAGGVLSTLALMHQLAPAAFGPATRRQIIAAMATLTMTVLLMVGAQWRAEAPLHERINSKDRSSPVSTSRGED